LFTLNAYDFTLFVCKTNKGHKVLLLYINDMIIINDNVHVITQLKKFLNQHFEMKDLDKLNYFLGLKVSSDGTGYYFLMPSIVLIFHLDLL